MSPCSRHQREEESRRQHAPDCCGARSGESVSNAGRDERAGAARFTFRVQGLDCAEEVSILKREVGPLVGGESALAFDVLNGRMMVLEAAGEVTADEIRRAVARTGMSAEEVTAGQPESGTDGRRRRLQSWFTALSGVCLVAGIGLHAWFIGGLLDPAALFAGHPAGGTVWPERLAWLLAIAFGVRYVLPKAWFAARRLRPDMNLLMVIAVAGAVGIGEWLEGATVAFLFALSLALEGWSVGRARRAISALLDLAPPTARVRDDDGRERQVPAGEVEPGTRFVVRPGERIPLDGHVAGGTSSVDQAPITGESVPVSKAVDDEVFAGTINGDGVLEIVSTKAAGDTTLARIIRMVEEAQARRANVEQWVERFARIYTPAVLALAVLVLVVPPLAFGGAWADWFYRALVLLVIACPCALVISTPVSIVAALAAAARHGVLVKGGVFIEQPAALRALAFDKTGTLTRGEPAVVGVIPLGNHSERELVERAVALEAHSGHPLARAVSEYARSIGADPEPAEEVQVVRGRGVTGRYRGERFWLGSHRYLAERGQDHAQALRRAEALEREGKTVVLVGNDRHVCGLLAIADTVRPDAAQALRQLRAAGIEHLVMLTGDNRTTADAIARSVGIDEVHAELLPEHKVEVVEQLVEKYGRVAMVGDGVNDAPAMARAHCGIAMGAAGSDAAIETADIALMTDDLDRLPWLRRHARRTVGVIRANIAFSLGIKALFVVLTFTGFATLWGAIAADLGATLLVVLNALRLLRDNGRPLSASGANEGTPDLSMMKEAG